MNWNHTLWESEKCCLLLRCWISCCSDVKNLIDMLCRVDGYYCAAVRVRFVISDCEICLPKCTMKGKKYEVNSMFTVKACGGMSCSSIHCFLTSKLNGSEWSSPCSEKRVPQNPLIMRLFSPHRRLFWRKVSFPFRKSNRKSARSDSNSSTVQIVSQRA
jgi:hypothetical protein